MSSCSMMLVGLNFYFLWTFKPKSDTHNAWLANSAYSVSLIALNLQLMLYFTDDDDVDHHRQVRIRQWLLFGLFYKL